jgi:hypothetical protein
MLFSLVARPLPVNFVWVNPYLPTYLDKEYCFTWFSLLGLETGAPGPLRLRFRKVKHISYMVQNLGSATTSDQNCE